MTVVSLPEADKPVVSLRLVFRAGSVDDPLGKEGLTALTTRLLLEGGTQALTSAQLIEALYPMAAELDGHTDKEFTVVSGRVPTARLEQFLTIFTDTLLHPRLDPGELERLRTEQLNAVRNHLRAENDEELGKAALDALIYDGHPYRTPPVGTERGLAAVTLADVQAQWKRVFSQDRLIIGLAGAVDDALAAKVKATLSALPTEGAVRAPLPEPKAVHGQTLIVKRDTNSTAGSFGFTTDVRRGDADFYALALGLSYFGEHRQEHGVLFREVRDRRGLNYGTYAYAEHYQQSGWGPVPRPNVQRTSQELTLWLRPVESKNGVFATRVVLFFLDQLLHAPLPREHFETARGFLLGATRLWTQGDQRRLGWAIDEVLTGTPGFLDHEREAIAALTPEQVQAALQRHLSADALNFAYVTRDGDGLLKALTDGQPSPITYATPKPPDVLEADQGISRWPLPMKAGAVRVIDGGDFMQR